ncbi:PTS sugar transporter subunit IIA [Aliivibrio fischeri]|uniref:PTS sugar transporter subunit IIA n=1 Tax=Aliivibrio fischeri TaxID=668 RepID=UPI0007C587AA|nr:PTS sugar transporter subunit IIA [Aliivibrio fischeri]
MLYDLIDHDLIDVVNHDIDAWEDAVKTTTRYLEQKGYVTANYADAIIQSTYDNGPYYVLCPGIAMPHARPEAGVIKTGLGIHIFPSAIEFGSDLGPANILLTLAAKDSDTHIEVIQALSEMLVDEENIAKLTAATSKNEVLDIIKGILRKDIS